MESDSALSPTLLQDSFCIITAGTPDILIEAKQQLVAQFKASSLRSVFAFYTSSAQRTCCCAILDVLGDPAPSVGLGTGTYKPQLPPRPHPFACALVA